MIESADILNGTDCNYYKIDWKGRKNNDEQTSENT